MSIRIFIKLYEVTVCTNSALKRFSSQSQGKGAILLTLQGFYVKDFF